MVNKCATYGCMTSNESTRSEDSGKTSTFHFPKNKPELNEKWIMFLIRHDWSTRTYSAIRVLHFNEHFIARGVRERLKCELNLIQSIYSKFAQERPLLPPTSIATPWKQPNLRNVRPDELEDFPVLYSTRKLGSID